MLRVYHPGLIKSLNLSKYLLHQIATVADYDLSFITQQCINFTYNEHTPAYCPEQIKLLERYFIFNELSRAKKIALAFKKFIVLLLIQPKAIHIPTNAVMLYWQIFILHQNFYSRFCECVWGNQSTYA